MKGSDDELYLSAERIKQLNSIDKVCHVLYVYQCRSS